MASDRKGAGTTERLFVGIRLPAKARAALYERSRQLRASTDDAVRLISQQNYHITLHFIGDPRPLTAPLIQGALEERVPMAVERELPLDAVIDRWGAFPTRKHPRVVWAAVQDAGGIAEIAAEVTQALTSLGLEPPHRRVIPHITVGYLRGGAAAADVKAVLEAHAFGATVAVGLNSVSLIKSTPGPDGSVYEDLKTWRTPR